MLFFCLLFVLSSASSPDYDPEEARLECSSCEGARTLHECLDKVRCTQVGHVCYTTTYSLREFPASGAGRVLLVDKGCTTSNPTTLCEPYMRPCRVEVCGRDMCNYWGGQGVSRGYGFTGHISVFELVVCVLVARCLQF